MKSQRWRRIGCTALTLSAAVFFLLWLLVAILVPRSYWRADCLGIRLENRRFELSSGWGRFYVRTNMFLSARVNPFAYDKNWGWTSYGHPSRIVPNMHQRSQDFGGNRWQFLGFRTVRGPNKIGNIVWLRYVEGPLWPILVVFAVLPACWLWRHRSWPREQQRRATRTLLLTSFTPVAVADQSTLWCKTRIGGQDILLASVHLTPYNMDETGLTQTQQLLNFAGDRPAVLACDFNAQPNEAEIRRIVDTGRFAAKLDGPFTISSHKPRAVIDHIFVPRDWQLLEHRVIQTDLSDHLPVVSTYRVPLTRESHKR